MVVKKDIKEIKRAVSGEKIEKKKEVKEDADIDNDGKVSYEEFKNARMKHMEEHFKRRDTNGDGYIDADERQAARAQMKAKYHDKENCERKHQ